MCATAGPVHNPTPEASRVKPTPHPRETHPAKHPDGTYADPARLAVRMLACDRYLRRLERYHRANGEHGYAAACLTARDMLAGRLVKRAVPR